MLKITLLNIFVKESSTSHINFTLIIKKSLYATLYINNKPSILTVIESKGLCANYLQNNYKKYFYSYFNLFKKNNNLEAMQVRFQVLSLIELFLMSYLIKKCNFQCAFLAHNYYKTLNRLELKPYLFNLFKKRIRRFFLFKKYKINRKKTFYMLYSMFVFKDLRIFKVWVDRTYKKIRLKLHRIFFRIIKILIRQVFVPHFQQLSVLGISVSMKGKISATGASKKKKLFFKFGKTSNTLKNQRVLSEQLNIKTSSGNLGVLMYLYY